MENEWENWSELSQPPRVRPSILLHAQELMDQKHPPEPCSRYRARVPRMGIDSQQLMGLSRKPSNRRIQRSKSNRPVHTCQQFYRQMKQLKPKFHEMLIIPNPKINPRRPAININLHEVEVPTHESFQSLPKEDQQLLAKIHKNLGHPSTERMSTILLQQGFRPEMGKASRNYQCSVCVQNSQPKNARPSAPKDDLDFNDSVSIDGLTWTNKKGRPFHLYHVLDWRQTSTWHM